MADSKNEKYKINSYDSPWRNYFGWLANPDFILAIQFFREEIEKANTADGQLPYEWKYFDKLVTHLEQRTDEMYDHQLLWSIFELGGLYQGLSNELPYDVDLVEKLVESDKGRSVGFEAKKQTSEELKSMVYDIANQFIRDDNSKKLRLALLAKLVHKSLEDTINEELSIGKKIPISERIKYENLKKYLPAENTIKTWLRGNTPSYISKPGRRKTK